MPKLCHSRRHRRLVNLTSAQPSGMPVASVVSDEDIHDDDTTTTTTTTNANTLAQHAFSERPKRPRPGSFISENEPLSPQSPWGHFVDLLESPSSSSNGMAHSISPSPSHDNTTGNFITTTDKNSGHEHRPYPLKRQRTRRKLLISNSKTSLHGFFLGIPDANTITTKPSSKPTPVEDAETALQHLSF